MSAANERTIERAVDAINGRDIDRYLDCCTDDVELRTPAASIEGAYQGAAGIRRFLSDVAAAGPNFQIEIERMEAIGANRVLAFTRISATGRESGVHMGGETAHIYEFVGGRIRRITVFFDRDEASREVRLAE